jgi:hypothetical protein
LFSRTVAARGHVRIFTDIDRRSRNGLLLLELVWRCNKNRCHTAYKMQINVAMEKPNAWVIGFEAEDNVAICWDHDYRQSVDVRGQTAIWEDIGPLTNVSHHWH